MTDIAAGAPPERDGRSLASAQRSLAHSGFPTLRLICPGAGDQAWRPLALGGMMPRIAFDRSHTEPR